MADGLKPGQRKVIFAAFKKNLVKEIKVCSAIVGNWTSFLKTLPISGCATGRIRFGKNGLPPWRSQLDDDHRRIGAELCW